MNSGFTRGLVVGSIIGASVSMIMNNNMMQPRNRRKMMRTGKALLRKSGGIISYVVDVFR